MNIVSENKDLTTSNSISEILKVSYESKNSIEWEEKLHKLCAQWFCELVRKALEEIDEALYQDVYKPQGYRVSRKDSRTISCRFGDLTYTRRLLTKGAGTSFYPLDHKLGFEKGKRYSLSVISEIAKLMAMTTSRNTSAIMQELTRIPVSHQTAVKIKDYVGQKAIAYEEAKANETPAVKEVVPEGFLAIEGDGIVLKGKDGGKKEELHRIQIYTGVEQVGSRKHLVGLHCFEGLDRAKLVCQVKQYLHNHFDLGKLTVLSNGDGGSGYQFNDFEDMAEGCKAHYHCRDRYHVNEKIRTRLSFCDKALVEQMIKDLSCCSDIRARLSVWMDTAASQAKTPEDLEQVEKLRAYLERNADYLPSLKKRGITTKIHLGTAETNHRYYSYRLKRQGRVWSHPGLENMAAVLNAMKNHNMDEVLLYKASGKNYKKHDRAFNKAVRKAARSVQEQRKRDAQRRKQRAYRPGCQMGRIGSYGPSTAPMARLARAIQF